MDNPEPAGGPPIRQKVANSEKPKRLSRLATRTNRMKGKKSQSLPVIKTPLDGMRLVTDKSLDQDSFISIRTSSQDMPTRSSSPERIFSFATSRKDGYPASPSDDEFFSDEEFHRVRPRATVESVPVATPRKCKPCLIRLSSLVKCPSSSSLNRPLGFATDQLLHQTSRVSTGSLKSLSPSEGNGSYSNGSKPLHLPPIPKVLPLGKMTQQKSEGKKLHHSWTVTGMSQYQDSVDSVSDRESMLPKILTKDARLRSYLVGNVSGKGSLLGEEELNRYFPNRKVEVFVATWNMNGLAPPPNLDDLLLPQSIENVPDIYAIGVQEAMNDKKRVGDSAPVHPGPVPRSLSLCLFGGPPPVCLSATRPAVVLLSTRRIDVCHSTCVICKDKRSRCHGIPVFWLLYAIHQFPPYCT